MKTLQHFIIAATLFMSTTNYSAPITDISDLKGLSEKIEELLDDCNHSIDQGIYATVFFSVGEDNSIQYVSVASSDSVVANKLENTLLRQKLTGNKWRMGIIYELTVGRTEFIPK